MKDTKTSRRRACKFLVSIKKAQPFLVVLLFVFWLLLLQPVFAGGYVYSERNGK